MAYVAPAAAGSSSAVAAVVPASGTAAVAGPGAHSYAAVAAAATMCVPGLVPLSALTGSAAGVAPRPAPTSAPASGGKQSGRRAPVVSGAAPRKSRQPERATVPTWSKTKYQDGAFVSCLLGPSTTQDRVVAIVDAVDTRSDGNATGFYENQGVLIICLTHDDHKTAVLADPVTVGDTMYRFFSGHNPRGVTLRLTGLPFSVTEEDVADIAEELLGQVIRVHLDVTKGLTKWYSRG